MNNNMYNNSNNIGIRNNNRISSHIKGSNSISGGAY